MCKWVEENFKLEWLGIGSGAVSGGYLEWHGRGIIVIGQWNLELWAGIIMSNNYSQIDKLENL